MIRSTSTVATRRVYVGPQGQGSISWMLADGSEAYLRARGLSSDELVTVARALTPRPATVAVPGFDVTAARARRHATRGRDRDATLAPQRRRDL